MAKLPASWAAKDGSSTATQSGNGYIDQESGFKILQESGFGLLQEDITMTPKPDVTWDAATAKADTSWAAKDGSSTLVNIGLTSFRLSQNGVDLRLMQNGTDFRIVNEIVVTPKTPSTWDSL